MSQAVRDHRVLRLIAADGSVGYSVAEFDDAPTSHPRAQGSPAGLGRCGNLGWTA
nr:hypothetical protein [Rhodococcus sp. 06-621-2]